jgi:hypothetical protein
MRRKGTDEADRLDFFLRIALRVVLTAGIIGFTPHAHAQTAPGAAREKRGVVSRLAGGAAVPVGGVTVVLHRIAPAPDPGGPLDSALTNSSGQFRITIRPSGDPRSEYYLASSYSGVAYLTRLGTVAELDSASADVIVFDTTTAPIPVTTLRRDFVVLAPAMDGKRRIVESHNIANDSSVTRVVTRDSAPVWSVTVPSGVGDFMAGMEESNPHALRLEGNEVSMYAPLAPGLSQLIFSYTLAADAFPLTVAVSGGTELLIVMLEESTAAATAVGLRDEGVVNIMGRNYSHSYTAQGVPENIDVVITTPETAPFTLATYLLIVVLIVGTGMLVSLAVAFRRRAPLLSPAAGSRHRQQELSERDALARRIAVLDDEHAANPGRSEQDSAAYRTERERLKEKLAALLARGDGQS